MPRLLDYSELSSIADIIDRIPLYGSSWNQMSIICKQANIEIKSFLSDLNTSKVKCLKAAFTHYQEQDKTDHRLYDLIRVSIPIQKAKTDKHYISAVNEINEIFKAPGINMYFDVSQRNGLIDLNNPPSGFNGVTSNAELVTELEKRGVPKEILKYCPIESFDGNGATAVFEAIKGLMNEVRNKANIPAGIDGQEMIDNLMLGKNPPIKLNSFITPQDKKNQIALGNLFKNVFSLIRNPLAHNPVVLYNSQEDLYDFFSIISLLYRKLKNCTVDSRLY